MLGEIRMDKLYKFNKYLYLFIFTIITMLVFLIRFEFNDKMSFDNSNYLSNFFAEFGSSFKNYDIIYVTLLVFILYFYNSIYFNEEKYGKKNIIITIISFLISILTVLGKSYVIDGTLRNIYMSDVQIFKSMIFLIGYWIIYYAIIKKLFSIYFKKKDKKKKHF